MNGRRMVWIALFVLAATAVMMATSALANPPDIDNPPTEDWVFDSGGEVVISGKTWDINYNITVANDTKLVFEGCTFTFSDPAGFRARWVWVMWNASMKIDTCTFMGTGSATYYIYLDNETSIMDSTISGMMAPGSSRGGISAFNTEIDFTNTKVFDTDGIAIKAENCNVTADKLTVSNSGGDWTDGAAFMAMYIYNSDDDVYVLDFDGCNFVDNPYRGFGLRSYMNWAEIQATFDDCTFANIGQRGFDVYWGRDYSYDYTNASLDLTLTRCVFDSTHWDGFRYNQYDVRYDGTSHVKVKLDDCDFTDVEGSGAFVNVYRGDQVFEFVFQDCDFTNNAIGGRAALAFSNRYIYTTWDVTVTGCTFTDNDYYGLHIEHYSTMMDGGSYNIVDCTFVNMTYSMYIYNYRYSGYDYYNEFWIDGCDFSGQREAGVYQYIGYSQIPLEVHFNDCTFSNSDGMGLMCDGGNDQSNGVWWEVVDSTFSDLGDKAISFQLDYVMAGATLEVVGCDIDNTAGIAFMVDNSMDTVKAEHMLIITRTDITNSSDSAIDTFVYGYYSVLLTAELDTVMISNAMLNGMRVQASTNFVAATGTIDIDLSLEGVTIDTVNGNGIEAGTPKIDYGGTRTISVSELDVSKVNKGLVLSGLKGQLRDTSILTSLREDVTVIGSDVELFQPIIDVLDEDTVDVIEAGSVLFWYSLKVHVNWDTGVAVDGAVVEVTDNQRTLIGVFTQKDETGLPLLLLNSYQFRTVGQFTRSPYILNVTFRAIQKVLPVTVSDDTEVTIEISDIVPPKVFINEPLPDHLQRSTTIRVRGSSFDAESLVDKVELSLDGMNWIQPTTTTEWASWAHTFVVTEQDVIDNGGIFAIRARAVDAAGNEASTLTKVEVDPFPPDLRVNFPYDGLQTNQPTIDVRGVTEQNARVEVNGVEVGLVGTLFVSPMDLKEGPNTITIDAFDDLGNSRQVKMEVVLDTKPPYLVLLNPAEGQMFTSPSATVSGQAEDGLMIWVNGNQLDENDYNNGSFEYTVSLTRGANSITVRAMDMAGNEMSMKRSVILDDEPPVLAIQTPRDESHQNTMDIAVVGTTDPDATLLVNGVIIELDNNLFAHAYVGVEGPNSITIEAGDMAGNIASVTLTVYIDTAGPTMEITSPIGMTDLVTSPSYTIGGQAAGAAAAFVNGERHDVDAGGAFSVPVTLLEGENRFIISVEDLAGNSVTENRYVTLDSTAPLVVVQIPNAEEKGDQVIYKTKKGQSTMTMTGYTSDAILVRVSGETVPLSNDGYFVYDYLLDVNTLNTVTVTAQDAAGNTATWEQVVKHEYLDPKGDEGFDMGIIILVVGLILLALAIYLGRRRLASMEEEQELRTVEEEEVLAPTAMPEVEEEEEEDLDEEVLVDEEEVHELTPPGERPKTDTSRRTQESMDEVTIEIEEKELEEKDAESDVDADESEQEEGI